MAQLFLLDKDTGVLFNPDRRFHGWLCRKHPDGQWVTVRKLEPIDPTAPEPIDPTAPVDTSV